MAWVLVPCLDGLRWEFNAVSPQRDKGADGSIGDSSHTSASDHADDEASDVLRDRDADSKHEVHALDIDSTGPWPGGWAWFNSTILALVAREKAEYESASIVGRLYYVIWNGRIAERSRGWVWRPYGGDDPHTNHAHFSARYLSSTEADIRPWGVYEEDDMPTAEEIAKAVWDRIEVDPYDKNHLVRTGTWLRYAASRPMLEDVGRQTTAVATQVAALTAAVSALAGKDQVDEQAIVAGILAGLPPERIAAAIPDDLAEQVAQKLAERLAS